MGNYDALYEVQDDYIEETEEPTEVENAPTEEAPNKDKEEEKESKDVEVKEGEEGEEEVQEYKLRWEVNYDALYEVQDDYVEETDEIMEPPLDESAEETTVKHTEEVPGEDVLAEETKGKDKEKEKKKEEEEEEEDVADYKPK